MPIYQYQCDECYHQLEALQKMNAPKLVDCPECAAPALREGAQQAAQTSNANTAKPVASATD